MYKKILTLHLFLFILTIKLLAESSQAIYLWKEVPSMKNEPAVMFFHKAEDIKAKEEKRPAVIICPGGSYHHLGLYNEGYCSSVWFSKNSINAFMLKYRTNEEGYKYPAMLEDLQRAIQIVRENAEDFNVDPDKIGVIGYSAGGHLVTMAGEFFSTHDELEKIGIKTKVSLRPDFVIPVYPVVSMQDDIGHKWSIKSLLGKNPSQEKKDEFSMEMNVPSDMPPTYIVVAKDDDVVDYRNSLRLYDALQEKGIQNSELTVYDFGKHGFGMADTKFMKTFAWNEKLKDWLINIGIL